MFIAEYKFEKLWKYISGSAIFLDLDLPSLFLDVIIFNIESSSTSLTMNISVVEISLNKMTLMRLGLNRLRKKASYT